MEINLDNYDFDLLREWLSEDGYVWERREFVKAASARKNTKQNKGEELLIMNYKLEEQDKLTEEFFSYEQ